MLVTVAAMSAGNAAAQHAGHQMTQQPGQVLPSAEVVAACVEAQQYIGVLADRANARLEAARQSNNPQELRAAVADLQVTLVDIRNRAAACGPLQATGQAADPHAGHAMGGAAPSPAATPPPAPAEAIDPVCSIRVDPKVAPRADHQGKRYYFCSESDRQLFLKDPAKYIKK
jgi:YHS domain-containing protein